jgi:hypothetical protein
MDSEGWVNVIAPGSPDWKFLAKMFPHLNQTDAPDLEEARALFWEHCTQLCAGGISPDEVRNHLYTLGEDFRKNRGVEHNFMLNFRK